MSKYSLLQVSFQGVYLEEKKCLAQKEVNLAKLSLINKILLKSQLKYPPLPKWSSLLLFLSTRPQGEYSGGNVFSELESPHIEPLH